jgi:hypothetical protein
VTVLLPRGASFRERDFAPVEVLEVAIGDEPTVGDYRQAADQSSGEAVALLEPGVRAAGNWLSATVPFLARPELGAVVTPRVAPNTGGLRERAAAGVVESRVGAGLGYFRYTPGNIRLVRDFPAAGIVIRRTSLLELENETPLRDVAAAVARGGKQVLYTPESVVVSTPAPLFRPHLRLVWARGTRRGAKLRRGEVGHPTMLGAGVVFLLLVAVALCAVLLDFSVAETVAVGIVGAYLLVVLVAASVAALRHQSILTGLLVVLGIVSTHCVYAVGAIRGFAEAD